MYAYLVSGFTTIKGLRLLTVDVIRPEPITQANIDEVRDEIRERNGMPQDFTISSFSRYEQ